MENRIKALANFLEVETNEIETSQYYDNGFSCGNQEYLVLTDKEADEKAEEEITETLWAFKAEFIIQHCSTYEDMDIYEYQAAVESLQKVQERVCESLNPLVRALIEDMDDFVEDAIMSDGRGHFISHYDGEENEELIDGTWYYIYRID